SFFGRGSSERRNSGSRESQGLKVKKSKGLRAMERIAIGAARLKIATAAVTPQTSFARDRSAAPIPRNVCPTAARPFPNIHRPFRGGGGYVTTRRSTTGHR